MDAEQEDGRVQRKLAIARRLDEAEARQRREINDELERRSDAFDEQVDAVLSGEPFPRERFGATDARP